MTMQAPEILEIESGAVELPDMKLYGVLVGNIDDPKSWASYPFLTLGTKEKMTMCSSLWRGYISTYKLKADGTLTLEKLEYPHTREAKPDLVHEVLQGNFWLDLRETFFGNGVRVPFVEGKIVADRSQWKYKEGKKWFLTDWDEENSASLTVRTDHSISEEFSCFKVYVNGYIHGTPPGFSHLAPVNGIYTRFKPGSYRVIVRETEISKPNRAESNTVIIEVEKDSSTTLVLSLIGGSLELSLQSGNVNALL